MLNKEILFNTIIRTIDEIEEYTHSIKNYSEFKKVDLLIKKALKADLIDLGETLKDLKAKFDYELDSNDERIIKVRNLLSHQYWRAHDNLKWEIITYLPKLKERVKKELEH